MDLPPLLIEAVRVGRRQVGIIDRMVREWPNFVLRHFVKQGGGDGPPVLVVAPQSGHFGWLMRDAVLGLLPRHDVYLLEWRDASDIPAEAGPLGLDASIGAVIEAMRFLGGGLGLLGVSQSPVPILAAAALLAAESADERPAALVLMGGFIDPRRNPTAIGQLTGRLPPGWFKRTMGVTVAAPRPGAGRRVYPGAVHGQALARYLARHVASGGELARKVAADDGSDPVLFPFARLYSTLMDLPAEFAEDNARKVFAETHLPRGLLSWRGRAVELDALSDVALMTIEGGRDDSSGPDQTHAAHDLCRHIRRRDCLTAPECGHFGLFHGELWRNTVLPRVTEFLRSPRSSRR
jgi:poly(3-hydroxybutyrate) depolymerase